MFRSIFFSLFIGWSAIASAASVQVVVSSSMETGTDLITSQYTDFISYQQQYLALDTCSSEGKFIIDLEIEHPTKLVLEASNFRGQFLAEPGQQYYLTIPSTFDQVMKGEVYEWSVDSASVSTPQNLAIIDDAIGQFVQNKAEVLIAKRARYMILELRDSLEKLVGKTGYAGEYLDYSIAQLELMNSRNNKTIYNSYVKDRPILYYNEGYMIFLNQYYNDFFRSVPPAIKDDIIDEVEQEQRIEILDTLMALDFRLENDALRELITIKSLAESWTNPDHSQTGIRNMLYAYSRHSSIDMHRAISKTLLSKFITLKKGAKAPVVTGLDWSGDSVSSENHIGRYVLLEFTKQGCNACNKEQQVIQKLHKTYKRDIAFVSVCLDCDSQQVHKDFQNSKYHWPVIFPVDPRAVIEAYDLITFPQYALLDANGFIIKYPAPFPSERLEYNLYRVASQRTRRKSYLIVTGGE